MTCLSCSDCGAYFRRLVASWYASERAPRRSRDEVIAERDTRGRAIAARREFNKRKRAEKESRKTVTVG